MPQKPRSWDKKQLYAIGFILLTTVFMLFLLYGPLLTQPGDHLFTDKGDGLKNYYTFLYHIQHDSSLLHFEGMNYPFGEHIVFTDAQPLISGVLRFFGLGAQAIGIMNLLVLLSIPLGAVLLFLVFIRLKFDFFLSIGFAIGLTMLSPQAFRLPWYFGLAYHWVLPGGMLLWLHIHDRGPTLVRNLSIAVYVLLCALIHPYWLTMLSAMFAVFGLLRCFIKRASFQITLRNIGVQAVLPLLLFLFFLNVTDNHTGRNPTPFGFFEFSATPGVVFLPHKTEGTVYGPFFEKTPAEVMDHWEGRSYIGIVGNLGLFAGLIVLILALWKRKRELLKSLFPENVRIYVLAGFLVLPFAFALPFSIGGMEGLLELLPFVKQFRSIGRLAWIFYFSSGLLSLALLNYWMPKGVIWGRITPLIVGLLAGTIMCYEGLAKHHVNTDEIGIQRNLLNRDVLTSDSTLQFLEDAIRNINPESYQALVPIPWFHIGTEALHPPSRGGYEQFCFATAFSYHLGLPMTATYSARTSLDEARLSWQFFGPDISEKPLKKAFPSEKPFLIFSLKGKPLSQEEKRVRKLGQKVFENERIALYRLEFEDVWKNDAIRQIDNFQKYRDHAIFEKGAFYISDSLATVFFDDFEAQSSDSVFRGNGAWSSTFNGQSLLLDLGQIQPAIHAGKPYILSFWYQHGENRTHNRYYLGEKMPDGKFKPIQRRGNIYSSFRISGSWTLCEWEFKTPQNLRNKVFYFEGERYAQQIYVDDLLLRPKGLATYQIRAEENGQISRLFFNNMILSR